MIQPDPVTPPLFRPWFKIGAVLVIVLFGMIFFGLAMGHMRQGWHREPPSSQPTTVPAPLPPRVEP